MVCADVRTAILKGELPAEVRAHSAECPACAELVAEGGKLGRRLALAPAAEPDLGPLLARVQGAVQRDVGFVARLRSCTTPLRVAIAVGCVVLIALYQLAFSRRGDLQVYPPAQMLLSLGSHVLAIGLALTAALRPLQRPPQSAWLRPLLVVAVLLVPFVLSARSPVHENHPASLIGAGSDFLPLALGCFLYGTLLALPVLGLVWALDRGQHGSRQVALLAAGTGGLAANLALELHCPSTQLVHLLAGHATIGVVAVGAYAAFGNSLFSRRWSGTSARRG